MIDIPPNAQQLVDVQNRISRLRESLDAHGERHFYGITIEDIALISYALGIATTAMMTPGQQRLTEAERKALNALHRWLHSPFGDDLLIEEAQDFHEQVEKECPSDCARLEEEERMAYGRAARGDVEPIPGPGVCRVCGCTDDDCSQCVEKKSEPCHWVELDLCSACVEVKP